MYRLTDVTINWCFLSVNVWKKRQHTKQKKHLYYHLPTQTKYSVQRFVVHSWISNKNEKHLRTICHLTLKVCRRKIKCASSRSTIFPFLTLDWGLRFSLRRRSGDSALAVGQPASRCLFGRCRPRGLSNESAPSTRRPFPLSRPFRRAARERWGPSHRDRREK